MLWIVIFCGTACSLGAEPPSSSPKPLASYTLADRQWLGSFGGDVEVNPAMDLPATRSGEIEWKMQDGAEVKEGAVVAFSGALQIRQSAGQLALDEDAVAMKLKTAEWQHREKLIGLGRQVDELELRISKLSITPKERELLGNELAQRLVEEARELKKELKTLNEKSDPELRAGELNLEQRQIQQDIEKARADHEDLVHSMEILSPNDGILHILKSGYVRANDIIATVERRGHAVVSMQLLDPEVRSEAPDSLAISVSSPTGELISGTFSHIDRMTNARLGPTIYHFKLDRKPDAPFSPDLFGERMVTLYKRLNKEVRIVPKADFLFSYPQEIQRLGWAGFLRDIWPAARIVHIGPRSIALAERE
ncbi:hypothetical protein HQ447_05320 [bacterium]|nr:hypothetical protein [bacterium]